MLLGSKPLIVLGQGVRLAGVNPSPLLNLGVPVISSWLGADLVDNWHPNYFGRPGVYGQRAANKILYEAENIYSLGCRLSPWMVGHGGLRPEQKVWHVNCEKHDSWLDNRIDQFVKIAEPSKDAGWLRQCEQWADEFPLLEACHDDTEDYVNTYRLMAWLSGELKEDDHIVVDTGCLMAPVFQVMKFKPPQRVMLSGGLGQMGSAIPAAIGACFAREKKDVLAFMGDGGAMMNIQDLATIAYYKLPVKMIVFDNDGYAMIRGTFNTVKREKLGVDRRSGIGFPDFANLAASFGISSCNVQDFNTFQNYWKLARDTPGPFLIQLQVDPEQVYFPRLTPILKDGKFIPPRLDQLSPEI